MSATRASTPGWPAFAALTARELVRFTRQPSRVFAAIGTPLILGLFFGSGFAQSFAGREAGTSYTAYLLPGMISLTVMFSSIFAAMSLIEDRSAGFLQSVLVSPAPRWAGVSAKIAGGTLVASAQGLPLLLLAPLLGLHPGASGYALAIAAVVLISIAVSGLGLAAAWKIDSSQGFHGVMNIVLMPMWLLSGAIFPIAGAAGWLRIIMTANPLYWPTAALRDAVAGAAHPEPFPTAALWAGAALTALAGFALAWLLIGRVRRSPPCPA